MKLPWFPFYFTDFETSPRVRVMGPIARCYYMTLLAHQWQEGSIPSNRQSIERLLNMPDDWQSQGYIDYINDPLSEPYLDKKSTLDTVLDCFKPDGKGGLVNERMETIRRHHSNIRSAQSEGAKESWKRRKHNNIQGNHTSNHEGSHTGTHQGNLMESESDIETETENTVLSFIQKKEPKKSERSQAAARFVLPDWIPNDSWSDFLEYRRRIRKPMTDRAKELAVLELEKLKAQGQDARAVIDQSISKGWQGLFPLRGSNGKNSDYEIPLEELERISRTGKVFA